MALLEFENLLRATIGLDVASIGASAVERAVSERLRACDLHHVNAYWDRVRGSEDELQALIDAVVVGETWFFRDRPAFELLNRFALEEWLPANPERTLRVLSLPSSTGEEPYSIAMSLVDSGMPSDRFRVDGVDVSRMSLARAEQAEYGRNSFRGADLGFRSRHFDASASGHRLRERIREQVHFRRGNICVPGSLSGDGVYDVIFCRNLLIYFDRATQDRAIDVIERLLAPEGLLLVAPCETSLMLGHAAGWLKEASGFAFRRGVPAVARLRRVTARQAQAPLAPTSASRIAPLAPFAPTSISSIAPLAPLAPTSVSAIAPLAPLAPLASPKPLDEATRLADLGRFAEAAACCEDHLRRHGPSAAVFHLLGVLRDASRDTAEAISCYRKSLYLDPNNQEVLIHLALLLEKLDKKAEAQILRNRERRVAGRIITS